MPPSSESASSSSRSAAKPMGTLQQDVLYSMRERVDVEAGERMMSCAGMQRLREECEPYWQSVCNTVAVTKAMGGYVPVDYTRPKGCPDHI